MLLSVLVAIALSATPSATLWGVTVTWQDRTVTRGGPARKPAAFDSSRNMVGSNGRYVRFVHNVIEVGDHSLPRARGAMLKRGLAGTATPQPGVLILLGSALLCVAGVLRRNLK